MAFRDYIITAVASLALTPLLLISIELVGAQVMESTSYKIESDSVNFGGGLSSSTNYSLESTFGESGTGIASSTNYNLSAGYLQTTERYIAMSAPANITMSPDIPGIAGGIANGSTTVTVTTDSAAGYQLTIRASSDPAMQKGADSIADYSPAGAEPDFEFTTGATDSHLGYSPSGEDVASRFLDNTTVCGTGGSSETALKCWDGLSTSDVVISQGTTGNSPVGATTTVNFRVGIGGSVVQVAGVYVATTTLTAVAL